MYKRSVFWNCIPIPSKYLLDSITVFDERRVHISQRMGHWRWVYSRNVVTERPFGSFSLPQTIRSKWRHRFSGYVGWGKICTIPKGQKGQIISSEPARNEVGRSPAEVTSYQSISRSLILAVRVPVRVHRQNRERRSVHPFTLKKGSRSVHRSAKMNAVRERRSIERRSLKL